jgi:hypothetical protein
MTAREIFFGLALLSVAINATAANPSLMTDTNSGSEIVSHEGSPKTNLPLVLEDNVFSSAYYDVLDILSARNRCSEFFGGAATIDIFNRMVAKMRKNYFSANIGIRMSGKTENIIDRQTNRVYRLFEKVSINANGPFYRGKSFNFDQSLPGVGTYKPATREVRVLMLLHELGHAVTTDDGKWLLPNDGNDEDLSRSNSMKIETMCGKEIADLGRIEGKTEVAASAADAKDH